MDAVLDDFPAGDDHHEGDEGRQQHQPYREAVDAERILDAQALDPGLALDELQRSRGAVEPRV